MFRVVAALLLSALSLPALAVEWVGALSDADRHAVLQAAEDADARWNARDAAGLTGMYSDDGTLVVGGGELMQGRALVLDYFTRSFARTPAELRHTTTVDRVVVLAPDLVMADTRVALDRPAEGGAPARVRDFNTLTVLVRREGQWRLHAVRAMPATKPQAAQ